MNPSNVTPMIKQYLSVKEQYPDSILFYRMGDFYEMFFEDAELASRLLEITLTSRNKKDKHPIPMCGVPYRAAQGYIARLIEKGRKVAICDQVEDPAAAKGLVKREVVRVVTPGMVVENELLDAKANNFILAVARLNDATGIASLDISTGAFRVAESKNIDMVAEEALRIDPREVLFPEAARHEPFFDALRASLPTQAISFLNGHAFDYRPGRERLLNQFGTLSLEGFGCEHLKAGICAAGALVFYVSETQKQPLAHLKRIEPYTLDHYLIIDDQSRRNLELTANLRSGSRQGTLIDVLDQTLTAMGGRLLLNWLRYPLVDLEAIDARLDAVAEAKQKLPVTQQLRTTLKAVFDLERLGSKIVMGHCNARDMVALKRSLQTLPEIEALLAEFTSPLFRVEGDPGDLALLAEHIDAAIREDAPPTINEGGIIRKGFNTELDDLISISRDGKGWLAELEGREKNSTGIATLKVRYNKVFGYYIEIPKSRAAEVPVHYVRKQTLVNAERYITDELKQFETKVLGAEERRAQLEYEIFQAVRQEVARNSSGIQAVAAFLARVDCLANLAAVADRNAYVRPRMNATGEIRIVDGRHPVVEKLITAERFVPNSIAMDNEGSQVLIITGPNMAGKSTILRQVALQVLMAQVGSFVPAREADLPRTDRIFTRVGALDNLSQGQSTFMVEMQETANILNNATGDSLVIMDEIGRGTSTFDGLSIAWAVAEYLHDLNRVGVKTLFATHYHELTALAAKKERVRNFNIAVKEWNDEIIFLRKLVNGGTNRSYGIQVARLAGIPDNVIARAKKILFRIENGEHGAAGFPSGEARQRTETQGPVQLDLFQSAERTVVNRLKKLDIERLTPIEALNCLHELKDKIAGSSE